MWKLPFLNMEDTWWSTIIVLLGTYVVTCLHFPVTTLMAQESLWPEREKEPQRILSKLCRKQQRQLLDNAAAYCDMGLLMLSVSR